MSLIESTSEDDDEYSANNSMYVMECRPKINKVECDFTKENDMFLYNIEESIECEIFKKIQDSLSCGDDTNINEHTKNVKCQIKTDNDLIRRCFENELLTIWICQFLSIKAISVILMYFNNSRILKIIKESWLLSRIFLSEIIQRVVKIRTNPDNNILEFAKILSKDCVNGIKHPFDFINTPLLKYLEKCVTIGTMFKHIKCYFNINGGELPQINYTTYVFFQLQEFELWNYLFQNQPLVHYVKLFLPFTHCNISETFIHVVSIHELKKFIYTKIKNINSIYLEEIFSRLWVIYNPKGYINHQLMCNGKVEFYEYLCVNYKFRIWSKFVDWQSFFIAGGSIISALTSLSSSNNSDIDIFSIGLSLNDFIIKLNRFQSNLTKTNVVFQVNQFNKSMVTFILIINVDEFEYDTIKIQFIWTCSKATIAKTLSSFDLGATQIGFRPHPFNNMYITDACLYFLIKGQCIVYNTIIPRIKKYEQKGISVFLMKSHDDLPDQCISRRRNKPSSLRNYVKIQINDDEPLFLSRFSYYEFTTGHCVFRSKNIDYNNIFDTFLSTI